MSDKQERGFDAAVFTEGLAAFGDALTRMGLNLAAGSALAAFLAPDDESAQRAREALEGLDHEQCQQVADAADSLARLLRDK